MIQYSTINYIFFVIDNNPSSFAFKMLYDNN